MASVVYPSTGYPHSLQWIVMTLVKLSESQGKIKCHEPRRVSSGEKKRGGEMIGMGGR